jgi:4-alpha-glucanotransferase
MNSQSFRVPPFPAGYRASGLLLHITSLPSSYGIGDTGPAALAWIDRLAEAGQSWWQSLPLGPTGHGNSPYEPMSSFAANALLISPDWLIEDGLVRSSDCEIVSPSQAEIDYETVIASKHRLLQTAWTNFKAGDSPDLRSAFEQFRNNHARWLEDYALFWSLKEKFRDAYYLEWPAELVLREAAALERARRELKDKIGQVCFAQFLAFRQGERLKAYAHLKGVGLIGDVPFYVSPDSSDVWADPQLFLLDEHRRPRFVGGVPPDYFSADGQLWGNPVYDWDAMRKTEYEWPICRLRALLTHVDVVRFDHFRGFVAAWNVPASAPTAKSGMWVPGPGAEFMSAAAKVLGALPFIAEDLGVITPDVDALRDQFQLPGMRILQFAFNGESDNPYLPHNYVTNTVVYTGTHDNPTTREWFEDLPDDQRQYFWKYLKRHPGMNDEVAPAMMELAWSSPAALAIAPLQDLLNLGREARMNVPGRAGGNWRWRMAENMMSDSAFERLRDLTKNSTRLPESIAHGGTRFESVTQTHSSQEARRPNDSMGT